MSAVYELPPEPPVGTIVVDILGRACQRRSAGWFVASNLNLTHDWAGILSTGPVTVVYSPEGTDPRVFAETTDDFDLVGRLRKAIRVRGGNVQYVLGSDR